MLAEVLGDRTIWGGICGYLTSVTLAQWSHAASILAALCTSAFMVVRIIQVLKTKEGK
jgi:hypothetical protein